MATYRQYTIKRYNAWWDHTSCEIANGDLYGLTSGSLGGSRKIWEQVSRLQTPTAVYRNSLLLSQVMLPGKAGYNAHAAMNTPA
jgi:hypothetical protein